MVSTKPTPTVKPPKARHGRNVVTGITLIGQLPAVEHVRKGHTGKVWRLWLSYNEYYDTGVYLELLPDGGILRQVVQNNKLIKTDRIKDED
jgi:hypothetical protein